MAPRRSRALAPLAAFALTIVACSSDGSSTVSSNEGSVVDDTVGVDDVTTTSPSTTAVATTEPSTTTAAASTTAPPATTTSTPTTVAPPTSDRPTAINDAATVDLDDAAAGAETDDGGENGAAVDCSSVARGVSEFTIDGPVGSYGVRVFVPASLIAEPAPVVLNFHGLTSNGPDQARYTGYEDLAADEGFVVVHPTGPANSWELTAFDTPGRDDLAFVDTLIDTLVADWCVDEQRVYSTGFSNGGFFTAELVCNRADRIAAAVAVGGLAHPDGCDPQRAVPFVAYHGTDDAVVPFDGSGESLLAQIPGVSTVFFTQVMPDEFAEFAESFRCEPEPTRTELTAEVVRYDYAGCDDGVPLAFYEIVGGGHTWPNSPAADDSAVLGYHTTDVDATVDAWAFFEQFSL